MTTSGTQYMAQPQVAQQISHAEAKHQGLVRYFTGDPCNHGHVAERYTKGKACTECEKIKLRNRYKTNPEKQKQRSLAYRVANIEFVREKGRIASKQCRVNSPEIVQAYEHAKYIKMRNDPVKLAKEQERQRVKQRKAYIADPEKMKARSKIARTATPEKVQQCRDACRTYKKNNPETIRRLNLKHNPINRAARLKRVPVWLSETEMEKINDLYKDAKARGLQVDHIIPLQGRFVSGLHVYANLQLLTRSENASKRNSYIVL